MKVSSQIKEELSDIESDYSSDISSDSNSNSAILTSSTSTNGETATTTSFTNFDGVHTGVPTRTTPTLTPTTLRNIEQTFIELQRETERGEPHQHQAGFVPPLVEPIVQSGKALSLVYNKEWIGGSTTITTTAGNQAMNRPTVLSSASLPLVQPAVPQTTRRNMGGRRPAKNNGISPEEEERRRVRRERNKMAAARCRKRRLDHTNELQKETEGLEHKRQNLQQEIQALQGQKEQLEFLLEAHKACCRLNGGSPSPPSPPEVKPVIYMEDEQREAMVVAPSSQEPHHLHPPTRKLLLGATAAGGQKPSRPSSLPVPVFKPAMTILEVAGVPITTPSAGIPFNFDSLMDGGTGLTPVGSSGLMPMIPSCSSQQRSTGGIDLSSPDSAYPPKQLVSL